MKYSTIGFVQHGPFNGATVGIRPDSEDGPFRPVAAYDGPFIPMDIEPQPELLKSLVALSSALGAEAVVEWASVPCHSLRAVPTPDGPPMQFDLNLAKRARQLAEIDAFRSEAKPKQKIDAEFIAPVPVPARATAAPSDPPEKDKAAKGRKKASTAEPN